MAIVYIALMIGVLVFIHELGHFLVAKLFDVHVERFAVGFGPAFLHWTRGETEYALCALPLGGYVKMYGMSPEELYDEDGVQVSEETASRAFVRKPLWQRSLIVLAGPAANLILPVFIYFFFALGTATQPPSYIGHVDPAGPASRSQALADGVAPGLEDGDSIVAINGTPTRYWRDLQGHIRGAIGERLVVSVKRENRTLDFAVRPEARTSSRDPFGLTRETHGIIGITLDSYHPIITAAPQSPAHQAGLRTFDRIVSIDGRAVDSHVDINPALRQWAGRSVRVVATRPESVAFMGGGLYAGVPITVDLPVPPDGETGIGSAEMVVASLAPDGAADRAGLKVGDEIVAMDDRPYGSMYLLKIDINNAIWEQLQSNRDLAPEEVKLPIKLTVRRDGGVHHLTFVPDLREIVGEFKQKLPEILIGFDSYAGFHRPEPIQVPWGDRFSLAVTTGWEQTWGMTRATVMSIWLLISGDLPTDSLGGPIMIGHLAVKAGEAGWDRFVKMMAMISINLGLLNLLPIPVLDGGYLMLFAIEAVRRKELTQRTRQVAFYVGFTMIIMLMLLAFKNDVERYWDSFAAWFN
jgi:regulator of sigma E protease